MTTDNIQDTNGTDTNNQETRTFTQDELNNIVEGRLKREREKYADYESIKAKASKYDEQIEAGKSELQKAIEKNQALQSKLDAIEKRDSLMAIRAKVATDTGVPVELLYGEDEETCKKQANAILDFAKPKSYPGTKRNKTTNTNANSNNNDEAMREFARSIFGGE